MTDDVISSGWQRPGREEAIASLFLACYPQLVQTAFGLAGDWAVAEELALEAFIRFWLRCGQPACPSSGAEGSTDERSDRPAAVCPR